MYNEQSIKFNSGKTLKLEGESREGVIIVSVYNTSVANGIIDISGSSSLSISNMKMIQSSAGTMNRNLIAFSSTGSFEMENCKIEQDPSLKLYYI
jgi:hypothetical protein